MNLFNLNTIENKMETSRKINFLFSKKIAKISETNADIKINKTCASFSKHFIEKYNLGKGCKGSFSIIYGELCFVHSNQKIGELYTLQQDWNSGYYLTFPKDAKEVMSKFFGAYKVKSVQDINEYKVFYLENINI